MNKRTLTKLQVRAEVLAVIQQLSTLEDSSKESQLKLIKRLRSIENEEYVIDCLLRELPKGNYDQMQVVAQLLLEFGSLEMLDKPLWSLIKDPNIPDELKDTANVILRNLGDTTDPNLYLSYLKNPQDLIDKETERMLKMASLDPEAQIDFLDFMFSLPAAEQLQLVQSLKDDYPGEYLTCIFLPALEARPSDEVYHLLIEALGNTRSQEAMEVLEKIYEYTDNDFEKKKLKKSLNLLKLSGVKTQKELLQELPDFITNSEIYKCYASPIDGIGNQGIIISRLLTNNDISLFSVVVNDIQGIVDCFGFSQISNRDFERIIKKFQEGTTRVDIPVEYCKYRMMKSEQINRAFKIPVPYEYSAWKILVKDITNNFQELDTIVNMLKDEKLINNIDNVYEISDFYCWFIEDDDHPDILNFFKDNLSYFITIIDDDNIHIDEIAKYFNDRIDEVLDMLFVLSWKMIYFDRLLNEAYLLKMNNYLEEAKLVATAAWTLSEDCNIPLQENRFIRKIMQKSVIESLLRFQYKIDDSITNGKSIVSKAKIDKYKARLDQLFVKWKINF
jgi:hypothetical protein